MIKTVGSVCSGIEAASVAWQKHGARFLWFSEIAEFPSRVLSHHYPSIPNLGDMTRLPQLLEDEEIGAPDLICGGTPCQAFSFAGFKNGLDDERGNLTLRFVDIVDANDNIRKKRGLPPSVVFWENVEGVLSDKTNAFGCLISSLAGLPDALTAKNNKWPQAGLLRGRKRNLCWRVLDAKFFGVPQQRRRLYLVAGGKEFSPESVLLEAMAECRIDAYPEFPISFRKGSSSFEAFRAYTDCLYSAYGTKWNGNAAAYNGSLYIVQNKRIRRFSPIECERLMGFPDHYTDLPDTRKTSRYKALGNSWAVPVVSWIGSRIFNPIGQETVFDESSIDVISRLRLLPDGSSLYVLGSEFVQNGSSLVNCTERPAACAFAPISAIVDENPPKDIYLSPVGCYGIVRRKNERSLKINPRLEEVLLEIASTMPMEEIEKKSRVQQRGRFSA